MRNAPLDASADMLLANTDLVSVQCDTLHCRLEFTRDDAFAGEEFAGNVPLLLPSRTSTVVVRSGVDGLIAYITLDPDRDR